MISFSYGVKKDCGAQLRQFRKIDRGRIVVVPEERRQKLSEVVTQRGFVSLPELVALIGVSESTIRRDLDSLDELGVLRRTHGGATAITDPGSLPSFDDRSEHQAGEKVRIAQQMAALIQDGETVLLDGGTTTFEVARQLVGRSLQVVTNSLPIANLFASSRGVDLVLLGGFVYPKTGVALGSITRQAIEQLHVNRLVISVGGVTERGLFNGNLLLVETERAMMESADETNVVCDHTKFGRQALAYLCDWSHVHRIVVDERVDPEQLAMVGKGVEIVVAGQGAKSEMYQESP